MVLDDEVVVDVEVDVVEDVDDVVLLELLLELVVVSVVVVVVVVAVAAVVAEVVVVELVDEGVFVLVLDVVDDDDVHAPHKAGHSLRTESLSAGRVEVHWATRNPYGLPQSAFSVCE